jgi:hypothetical protein
MFGNGGSNLANGATVTVNWIIKPELVNKFVATLETMLPQTRLREGFRNRRLLRSDAGLTEIVPLGCATCLPTLQALTRGQRARHGRGTIHGLGADPPSMRQPAKRQPGRTGISSRASTRPTPYLYRDEWERSKRSRTSRRTRCRSTSGRSTPRNQTPPECRPCTAAGLEGTGVRPFPHMLAGRPRFH